MSGYNEQGMMKMKTKTRRLANGDHRARGRELTGVSTAPEVRGRAYGWSDHRARGSVRYAIVRYTLFQQVNPIEHATIVNDQIGVESVDESSHRRTVTTKHDISDAILSANVRQRTLKSRAVESTRNSVCSRRCGTPRGEAADRTNRSIRRARRRTGTVLSNVRPVRRRRRCCTRRRSAKRQLL